MCTLSLLAIATDLLAGHIGKIGLSAAFFAGIAGYTYSILTCNYSITPFYSLVLSILVTIALSVMAGWILIQLSSEQYLLATFALQVAFVDLVNNCSITGGPLGIKDVPPINWADLRLDSTNSSLLILIPSVVIYAVIMSIAFSKRSQLGRAYHSIRDDMPSALSLGYPVKRLLMAAFILHSVAAALAGIGMVMSQTYVGPSTFALWLSLNVLVVVFVGGSGGNVSLMIVGSIIFLCLMETIVAIIHEPELVGSFQQMVFYCMLVSILIFRRRGLAGPKLEGEPNLTEFQ
jgi:ABC-type branched-subunit amino acid transport system permease subunit